MAHHILIVDDDPHIRDLLAFAVAKAGMTVAQAADGEAALAAIAGQRPSLVVLDINMPRMDGLEVCRRLRGQPDPAGELPILFLSSRDDEIDRILGIEMGADDYVTKPFSPREVVARIGAILKRGAPAVAPAAPPTAPTESEPIVHGLLALEPEAWDARWAETKVEVTATEFQLLRMLAASPAKVFSRDAIIERLHRPGFAITDRTIDSHVRNLRQKFTAVGGGDLIETKPGVGYRIGPCNGVDPA